MAVGQVCGIIEKVNFEWFGFCGTVYASHHDNTKCSKAKVTIEKSTAGSADMDFNVIVTYEDSINICRPL